MRTADGADREADRNGATLPKPDTQQFVKSKLTLIEALVVTYIICQVPSQQYQSEKHTTTDCCQFCRQITMDCVEKKNLKIRSRQGSGDQWKEVW